jgi:hypothetical protein
LFFIFPVCDSFVFINLFQTETRRMRLIHYCSLEPLDQEDLQRIAKIKEDYNGERSFWDRIKLWRKSDIIDGLEPAEARWGFTRVRSEDERKRLMLALARISQVTPHVTWIIFDDGNGGGEILMRAGKVLNGKSEKRRTRISRRENEARADKCDHSV